MSQAALGSVTSSSNATVPVVRTGDQQDDPQMQAPASVIPRIAVGTPPFECRVQYVRHEKKRTKYGGHQLTWLVNHPGHELHGQLLASYYPDNRQKGSWSPSSKFAKLWVSFTGRAPTRWNRLPWKAFKNRYGLAQVTLAQPEVAEKAPYFKITAIIPVRNLTGNGREIVAKVTAELLKGALGLDESHGMTGDGL